MSLTFLLEKRKVSQRKPRLRIERWETHWQRGHSAFGREGGMQDTGAFFQKKERQAKENRDCAWSVGKRTGSAGIPPSDGRAECRIQALSFRKKKGKPKKTEIARGALGNALAARAFHLWTGTRLYARYCGKGRALQWAKQKSGVRPEGRNTGQDRLYRGMRYSSTQSAEQTAVTMEYMDTIFASCIPDSSK